MNNLVSLVVRTLFTKCEYYVIGLIMLLASLVWFNRSDWAQIAAIAYLSPLVIILLRMLWQFFFGPRYTRILAEQLAANFDIPADQALLDVVSSAYRKDLIRFVEASQRAERLAHKHESKMRRGTFTWDDISWWRAYIELTELMDVVLLK